MDRVSFFFSGWEPVARIVVVAPLAYLALVVLLRTSGKRTLSRLNQFDFVVTVAIGATFGRIMTARSIPLAEAVTAFAVLILLQYVVALLQVRSPRFSQLLTAPPTLLCFRGDLLRKEMRAQRVTEQELLGVARQHGLGSLAEAEAVVMQSDGRFAVVRMGDAGDGSALGPAQP